MPLVDRSNDQHVGTLVFRGDIEVLGGTIAEHARRERTEALTELDLEVHGRLGGWIPRIPEDAPGSQGPRTELHPTVEPAHDPAIGQVLRDLLQ